LTGRITRMADHINRGIEVASSPMGGVDQAIGKSIHRAGATGGDVHRLASVAMNKRILASTLDATRFAIKKGPRNQAATRREIRRAVTGFVTAMIVLFGGLVVTAPHVRAGLAPPEQVYLYDVTFRRPDMHWASADAALAYGYGICDKVRDGRPYAQIAGDFKADFQTSDEYLASYVISDAAQQLCPELIWQLRNSAANYTPPPAQ